jgi:hypothetical protein
LHEERKELVWAEDFSKLKEAFPSSNARTVPRSYWFEKRAVSYCRLELRITDPAPRPDTLCT